VTFQGMRERVKKRFGGADTKKAPDHAGA
jgi:hypothetical protein